MPVIIDGSACTACGQCAEMCPMEAISIGDVASIDSETCIDCGACVEECPERALTIDWPDVAAPSMTAVGPPDGGKRVGPCPVPLSRPVPLGAERAAGTFENRSGGILARLFDFVKDATGRMPSEEPHLHQRVTNRSRRS